MPVDARYIYDSPRGRWHLSFAQQHWCALEFEPDAPEIFVAALPAGITKRWLDDYFAAKNPSTRPLFDIPGTLFQQSVYRLMLQIPYGQTLSYGEAAHRLGSAARAVGQACRRNPMPVLIPCHRIVAKHDIGGYEGSTGGHRLDRKKWLLALESAH